MKADHSSWNNLERKNGLIYFAPIDTELKQNFYTYPVKLSILENMHGCNKIFILHNICSESIVLKN